MFYSQRDNHTSSVGGSRHAQISSLSYPASYVHVNYMYCQIKDTSDEKHINVCDNYAVSKILL